MNLTTLTKKIVKQHLKWMNKHPKEFEEMQKSNLEHIKIYKDIR